MPGVVVDHISKYYGERRALDALSFTAHPGQILGLIGPDGAGKTTLIRIITSLILPDSGTVWVDDLPMDQPMAIRQRIGYMPGRFSLYQDLSVEENLQFFATIHHTTIATNYDRIAPIYRQIEPFKNRKAGALSGGMKQKLALSCALIHAPKVLVLDEPTTGVDPVSRQEFWDMLDEVKKTGMTLLVATPYMDEAARCDTVALIHEGSLLQMDAPDQITQTFAKTVYGISTYQSFQALKTLEAYPFTEQVYPFGEQLHYLDQRTEPVAEAIEAWLAYAGIKARVQPIQPDIEDCFMDLMRHHG